MVEEKARNREGERGRERGEGEMVWVGCLASTGATPSPTRFLANRAGQG